MFLLFLMLNLEETSQNQEQTMEFFSVMPEDCLLTTPRRLKAEEKPSLRNSAKPSGNMDGHSLCFILCQPSPSHPGLLTGTDDTMSYWSNLDPIAWALWAAGPEALQQ